LQGVFFTDANTGTVSGNAGTILRTTDGGTAWAPQTSGTSDNLEGVFFTDANTGFIVGQSGTILKTTDGGTNWAPQTSGITSTLFSVSFADANTGWAVGQDGIILKTIDGGTAWGPQTSGTPQWLLCVSFTDTNYGEAVGTGGANFRTTDGGTSWVSQTSSTEVLYGASFTDANTGTVVGENGTILRMSSATGIEDNTINIPANFVLMQNYPNPFNPSTTIQYAISSEQFVTLKIFNSIGQLIKTLVDENMNEGYHQVTWDATDNSGNKLSSGVYFYRLTTGTFNRVNKMLLMK